MIKMEISIGTGIVLTPKQEEHLRDTIRKGFMQYVFECADKAGIPHINVDIDGTIKVE